MGLIESWKQNNMFIYWVDFMLCSVLFCFVVCGCESKTYKVNFICDHVRQTFKKRTLNVARSTYVRLCHLCQVYCARSHNVLRPDGRHTTVCMWNVVLYASKWTETEIPHPRFIRFVDFDAQPTAFLATFRLALLEKPFVASTSSFSQCRDVRRVQDIKARACDSSFACGWRISIAVFFNYKNFPLLCLCVRMVCMLLAWPPHTHWLIAVSVSSLHID